MIINRKSIVDVIIYIIQYCRSCHVEQRADDKQNYLPYMYVLSMPLSLYIYSQNYELFLFVLAVRIAPRPLPPRASQVCYDKCRIHYSAFNRNTHISTSTSRTIPYLYSKLSIYIYYKVLSLQKEWRFLVPIPVYIYMYIDLEKKIYIARKLFQPEQCNIFLNIFHIFIMY